mmetsp:Transcript_85702/g.135329  ORF Transcript_85702/g.135329 Transcript_85702/m.135329 type:complete len:80 (-) Transcript_85702:96-335(-)
MRKTLREWGEESTERTIGEISFPYLHARAEREGSPSRYILTNYTTIKGWWAINKSEDKPVRADLEAGMQDSENIPSGAK